MEYRQDPNLFIPDDVVDAVELEAVYRSSTHFGKSGFGDAERIRLAPGRRDLLRPGTPRPSLADVAHTRLRRRARLAQRGEVF